MAAIRNLGWIVSKVRNLTAGERSMPSRTAPDCPDGLTFLGARGGDEDLTNLVGAGDPSRCPSQEIKLALNQQEIQQAHVLGAALFYSMSRP